MRAIPKNQRGGWGRAWRDGVKSHYYLYRRRRLALCHSGIGNSPGTVRPFYQRRPRVNRCEVCTRMVDWYKEHGLAKSELVPYA